MRDLINLLDNVLAEAAGGMSKRWLESQQSPIYFLDAQGNRYTIDNLVLFPLEQPFLPVAELGVEVEDTIAQMGLDSPKYHICKSHAGQTRCRHVDHNEESKRQVVSVFQVFS
jgi:hypothetical protein